MFSVSNPSWNSGSPTNPFGHAFNDPLKDPRTDTKFIERFSKDFERSAPVRFSRFLVEQIFNEKDFLAIIILLLK